MDGNAEFIVDYDYLVVAMGARANTFNTPGVEENCHFLKVTLRRERVSCLVDLFPHRSDDLCKSL